MRPIISQCPVVVSLPALTSAIRPKAATGFSLVAGSGRVCRSPIRERVGRWGCCDSSTWPRVLEPSSPKSAASGSSPTPMESQTRMMARLLVIEGSIMHIALKWVIFVVAAALVFWFSKYGFAPYAKLHEGHPTLDGKSFYKPSQVRGLLDDLGDFRPKYL